MSLHGLICTASGCCDDLDFMVTRCIRLLAWASVFEGERSSTGSEAPSAYVPSLPGEYRTTGSTRTSTVCCPVERERAETLASLSLGLLLEYMYDIVAREIDARLESEYRRGYACAQQ